MLNYILMSIVTLFLLTGCSNKQSAYEQTNELFNIHNETKAYNKGRSELRPQRHATYYYQSFKDLKKLIKAIHGKTLKIGVLPINNDSSNRKLMKNLTSLVQKSVNKLGEMAILITSDELIKESDILIDGSLFGYDTLVKIMKDKDLDLMVGKGKGETDAGFERDNSASLVKLSLSLFASNKGKHAYPNTQAVNKILVVKNSVGDGFSISVYGNGIGFGEQIQIGGSTDNAIELLVESALIEVIARKFSLPLQRVDKFEDIDSDTREAVQYYERKKFLNLFNKDKRKAIKGIEYYLFVSGYKKVKIDGVISNYEKRILNQIINKNNLKDNVVDIYLFLHENVNLNNILDTIYIKNVIPLEEIVNLNFNEEVFNNKNASLQIAHKIKNNDLYIFAKLINKKNYIFEKAGLTINFPNLKIKKYDDVSDEASEYFSGKESFFNRVDLYSPNGKVTSKIDYRKMYNNKKKGSVFVNSDVIEGWADGENLKKDNSLVLGIKIKNVKDDTFYVRGILRTDRERDKNELIPNEKTSNVTEDEQSFYAYKIN